MAYKRGYYLIALFISGSILGLALAIEKYMGHTPCVLCYYERIPYAVVASISLWMILTNSYLGGFLIWVMFFALMILGMLGVYHFGIEQGWMVHSCTGTSCAVVTFRIFGFSLAFWNGLIGCLWMVLHGFFIGE